MNGAAGKLLRAAAKTALAALAIALVLVGVAWMFLQTRRGGEAIRRFALPRVNAAIAGTVTLSRLAFGGDRLTLQDLALYDPDGRPVGSVAQIDVSFSPLALLRRHVDVTALKIHRPELALVRDERGLNLARALAARHPTVAGPGREGGAGAGGPRGTLDVRSLVVTGGVIDYRAIGSGGSGGAAGPDGDRHLHVADLSVRGTASAAADRLAAEVGIRARGGRVDARVAFDAAARRGYATLRASLTGVSLAVDGRIEGDGVDAHAAIDAHDLARTARGLGRDFGLGGIAMAGNGRIDISFAGTVAAPSLQAAARFSRLAFGDRSARDLTAAVRIPDLRAPEALDVDAGASAVSVGARAVRSATVAVRAAGRHIAVHAAVAAPQPLRIDLSGERARRQDRAITVDALSVRYPEASWTLRRRARLSFAAGTIALSGFELGADAQRLSADLHLGGARATAHLAVSHLDLSRLPRALVPASVGLGGTLDADVDVRGDRGGAPRLVAKATLAGGRIQGHRDLALDLAARVDRGRARGELRARGLGTHASAEFDLPDQWPPRNPRAPLTLVVETGDADLAAVAAAIAPGAGRSAAIAGGAGRPAARLKGRARVSLRLGGRIGQPRLQIVAAGRGLAFDDRRIGDLALAVNGEGDGVLTAQITSTAPARTRIDVTTPLSLRAILRHPPSAAALARMRFEVKGTIDRLPLAALALAAGHTGKVGGTLSATLAVAGTPSEPEGKIAIDVAGATAERYPPTDARIEVDFDPGAVAARARVVRAQRPLLALETRLGVPVGGLLARARLAAAPVHLRAVFGPYLVQRLGLPPLSDREPPRQLEGHLHADLAIEGTVAAPRVLLHAQASDLRLDRIAVGFGQVEASYAERKAKVDARLTSDRGGTLHALASMSADLGYPAVARGFDVRRAPLDVQVDAQRFDLRGLSGAVQALRTVGGQLTASATLRGTLTHPRPAGRLEWTDGVIAVTGLGEYRQIHLAVHGDEHGIKLDELAAASGSGTARLAGHATPGAAGGGFDLAADAKLDHFPIYSQGQSLAVVSLSSRFSGRAGAADTRLSADIDDARIELKDAKRKNLQSLDPPADVVLVDAGAPLNRAQAAKLRALMEAGHAHPAAAAAERPPRVRLHVNAPRHLWVQGKDANLELGLSPDFRVSLGDRTEIRGQVTVHRGRVDVFGRRFDIKADSTLTFAGPPDRPDVDVRAEHVNTTENVTVLLTAKGPLDKLTVAVTSPNRPDLGESQLYTLIITGHLQFGSGATGPSPSAQAASIVGGLLVSKLQSTLAHRLPLDVLTIDVGGEGVMGTKLEAGRYVTDRLYAGYVGRVGSDPTRYQNRNAVHLEYQITSRWELEGEYGDLGTGTADLMWKKSY